MAVEIPTGSSSLATCYIPAKYTYSRKVDGWDGTIDTITIHCTVGQGTAEHFCKYFAEINREASCNYCVGEDGSIGISVAEHLRSACTSSRSNDKRAVTIEVSSDSTHPYRVTNEAYKALINLVSDICLRNNIKRLVWSDKKDDRVNRRNGCNMTVHRDYANKECPGQYLYDLQGTIALEVNRRLAPPGGELSIIELLPTSVTALFTLPDNGASDYNYDFLYNIYKIGISSTGATKETLESSGTTIKLSNNKATFTIPKILTPNTRYAIEVFAKEPGIFNDVDSTITVTPRVPFITAQDYPKPASEVSLITDTHWDSNQKVTVEFHSPDDWGYWAGIKSAKKGYRVSLLINGVSIAYSDDLLSTQLTSSTKVSCQVNKLLNENIDKVLPGANVQIGVQPWVYDNLGNKILNNDFISSSNSIYLQHRLSTVNKAFLVINKTYRRVMVYLSDLLG